MDQKYCSRFLRRKKAQHIAEYMLVFEVFIVATIITITALGMLPDIGATSLFRTSNEMLSLGSLGLLHHSIDECGGYRLHFRNTVEHPITLMSIRLGNELIFSDSLTLQAGQETVIEGTTAYKQREGSDYALPLAVTFRDEETGAIQSHHYDEKIYGAYSHFQTIGKQSVLHQGLIDEYCLLGKKAPNHVAGRPSLELHGPHFFDVGNYYSLLFDGNDDYAVIPQSFTKSLHAFAFELMAYLNVTGQTGEGIVAKQNAFSLTTENQALRFTIIDHGVPYSLVSPPLHSGWWYIVGTYDGNTLSLIINDTYVTTLQHAGSIDGSTYPLYLGTFTPESNLYVPMQLLYFAFYHEPLTKEVAQQRYHILASTYFS